MEGSRVGSADERRARHSPTRTGPEGYRCNSSRVRLHIDNLGGYTTYMVYCEWNRQLHSSRPPLPDVPAVYFVSPTLPNIRRIAEDLDKALYESYHVNFSEPLSRSLLEELAASVARDNTGELIQEVCSGHARYPLCVLVLITYPRSDCGPISVIYCSICISIFTPTTACTTYRPTYTFSTTLVIPNPQLAIVIGTRNRG